MLVLYTCCTESLKIIMQDQKEKVCHSPEEQFLREDTVLADFSQLFRRTISLFKSGAETIGREASRTETMMMNDMLSGKRFKLSLNTRVNKTGKKLTRKAVQNADEMTGSERFKRKRKHSKHFISSKSRKWQFFLFLNQYLKFMEKIQQGL